jgi:hypothetical protein
MRDDVREIRARLAALEHEYFRVRSTGDRADRVRATIVRMRLDAERLIYLVRNLEAPNGR